MASLLITIYGSKAHKLRSALISGLLLDDEKCNKNDLEAFIGDWSEWLRHEPPEIMQPCLTGGNRSKCCGYFSSLVHKHWNMSTLAMTYVQPYFRIDHTPLLAHLGLNDKKGIKYRAPIYNIAPLCKMPSGNNLDPCLGKNAEALNLVYSSKGFCMGFNSPWTEDMYKVFRHRFMFCNLYYNVYCTENQLASSL